MANKWEKLENVFTFIEKKNGGRALTEGEKELIKGQRQINKRFFDAINEILETLSPSKQANATDSAKSLAKIKKAFKNVPGERPPGCAGDDELKAAGTGRH